MYEIRTGVSSSDESDGTTTYYMIIQQDDNQVTLLLESVDGYGKILDCINANTITFKELQK